MPAGLTYPRAKERDEHKLYKRRSGELNPRKPTQTLCFAYRLPPLVLGRSVLCEFHSVGVAVVDEIEFGFSFDRDILGFQFLC